MKKFILLITFFTLIFPNLVFASVQISPNNNTICANYFRVMASKATATANGTDSIDLTFVYTTNSAPEGCMGGGPSIAFLKIEASGSGNTLTKSTVAATNGEGTTFETTSVKSTVAGSKNITIYADWGVGAGFDLEHPYVGGSITFTAPAATTSTPTTSTRTTTRTTTTTTAVATTPTVPAAPVLEKLMSGNQEMTGTALQQQTELKPQERKVFSGKTIPNGIVKLYFQSDPFEDTVTADAQGNWTYELKRDLGTGNHSLQIAVTDPATNLTSEKSAPVAFKIAAAEAPKTETKAAKDWTWYYVGGGVLVAIILSGLLFFLIKKSKKKETEAK